MKLTTRFTLLAAIASIASFASTSTAHAQITLPLNGESSISSTNGTTGTSFFAPSDSRLFFGQFPGGASYMDVVFAFQLNSGLEANGTVGGVDVSSANFSVTDTANNPPAPANDLFAVRISSSPTIELSDFQTSAADLQANFANTTTGGLQSTTLVGQTNLASYLQNNWVEGDYVFLSVAAQAGYNPDNGNYYLLQLGNIGSTDATLTATVETAVPEPSTYALMLAGLGALVVFARRQRLA
jgi:hypothetical protein